MPQLSHLMILFSAELETHNFSSVIFCLEFGWFAPSGGCRNYTICLGRKNILLLHSFKITCVFLQNYCYNSIFKFLFSFYSIYSANQYCHGVIFFCSRVISQRHPRHKSKNNLALELNTHEQRWQIISG